MEREDKLPEAYVFDSGRKVENIRCVAAKYSKTRFLFARKQIVKNGKKI
jgi:hypothetical protein